MSEAWNTFPLLTTVINSCSNEKERKTRGSNPQPTFTGNSLAVSSLTIRLSSIDDQ